MNCSSGLLLIQGNPTAGTCVQYGMDPVLEYLFGTGEAEPTRWHTTADADADADGTRDAIWLDFDGDGHRDDLLWDTDADGRADVAALDLDDDGVPDHYYRDDGTGVWAQAVDRPNSQTDTPQTPSTPTPPTPTPPPPTPPTPTPPTPTPTPADPPSRVEARDLDGDGITDLEVVIDNGSVRRIYIDDDNDGTVDRVLVDTDGDGAADATYEEGAPGFGR